MESMKAVHQIFSNLILVMVQIFGYFSDILADSELLSNTKKNLNNSDISPTLTCPA